MTTARFLERRRLDPNLHVVGGAIPPTPTELMQPTTLPLSIVPGPTCLVALPLALHHHAEPPLVLQITPLGRTTEASKAAAAGAAAASSSELPPIYVGWGGAVSSSQSIEIPVALAEAFRLRPPLQVSVRPATLPTATALWVRPESAADWEVAQRAAEHLRDSVLMQVFAAAVGQRLPLWAHGAECVWVRVVKAEPAGLSAVRLSAGMDLIVSPPEGAAATAAAPAVEPPAAAAPAPARRGRRLRLASAAEIAEPPAAEAEEEAEEAVGESAEAPFERAAAAGPLLRLGMTAATMASLGCNGF